MLFAHQIRNEYNLPKGIVRSPYFIKNNFIFHYSRLKLAVKINMKYFLSKYLNFIFELLKTHRLL